MPGEVLLDNGHVIRPVKVLDKEYWDRMQQAEAQRMYLLQEAADKKKREEANLEFEEKRK